MAWNPFTSAAPAPTPAPQAPAPQAQPVAPTVNPPASAQPMAAGVNPGQTDPNNPTMGTNPGAANQLPTEPAVSQTPLEVLEQLWQNKPKADGEPVDTTLAVTSEVLDKVTPELNLSSGIDPDVMTKFQSGDVGAVQAVMEHMAKQAYASAMQHSLALVNNNLDTRAGILPDVINKTVKANLTESAVLGSGIPNVESPTVQRELKRVAGQFREANPNATPQEIAQATKAYFSELQSAMSPQPIPTGTPTESAQEWDDWLDS